MVFKKLSAPSLKELFVSELENMILSGTLEIGTKLPPERELAESMQVSRAVVNSGIAEMEKKGFLVVKPRIGTFVADYRRYGTTDTLVSVMHYNGGILRNKEVRSVLEVRVIFLLLAATLAIDNASDEEIEELASYLGDMEHCTSPEAMASLQFAFCHELGFISGNTLLPLFFMSFKDLVCSLWVRFAQKYGCEALYQSACEMYQYIKARDKEAVTEYIKKTGNDSLEGYHTIYFS